jgi:hypothetical protein
MKIVKEIVIQTGDNVPQDVKVKETHQNVIYFAKSTI